MQIQLFLRRLSLAARFAVLVLVLAFVFHLDLVLAFVFALDLVLVFAFVCVVLVHVLVLVVNHKAPPMMNSFVAQF